MKYLILLLTLVLPLNVFAGELITDRPYAVREFENFRIKLGKMDDFSLSISKKCISVQRMEGIRNNGFGYSSDEGVIYFENSCFEGDSVKITVQSGSKSEEFELRLDALLPEERDYGC